MKNQQTSARQKALTLVDMSSAFIVYGLGFSLAVLAFLIELIYKRIKDHYFDNQHVLAIAGGGPALPRNREIKKIVQ